MKGLLELLSRYISDFLQYKSVKEKQGIYIFWNISLFGLYLHFIMVKVDLCLFDLLLEKVKSVDLYLFGLLLEEDNSSDIYLTYCQKKSVVLTYIYLAYY